MFRGQSLQDKFVLNMLKYKKNGFFLEIGSNDPININNTYILEKDYKWNGIMVEYSNEWLNLYKKLRPNSIHIINDATKIDYKNLFEINNVPLNLDYLQIDLEVYNGSTLNTLNKLNSDVMDKYKFATVTFEHDIYRTNYLNTRLESRKIFENRGYVRIFSDINNSGVNPYEDWYIHPDLVDSELVNTLINKNEKNYISNVKVDHYFNESPVNKSINFQDIEY
jgi:hypothetical protein